MYRLQVVTPENMFFNQEVIALIAPGEDGYLGVLTHHAPILVCLKNGVLVITDAHNTKTYYHISAGFLEVSHNRASVLVETIEPISPVDLGIQEGF